MLKFTEFGQSCIARRTVYDRSSGPWRFLRKSRMIHPDSGRDPGYPEMEIIGHGDLGGSNRV